MSSSRFLLHPPPPPRDDRSPKIGPPSELAPIIARYHFYNDLTAGTLSITLNLLMMYIVTKRVASATVVFKRVMCISKIFDILFSSSIIMTAPVYTSIAIRGNFTGLMIINTGWQFSFTWSQIFLCASLVLLTQQIFLAPWLYYFRYAQVCRKNGIKCLDVLITIICNLILQCLTAVCFCYVSFPTSMDVAMLQEVSAKYKGIPLAFILFSYTKEIHTMQEKINQVLSIVSAVGYLVSLILSTIVMIFCTIRINIKVLGSKNISNNLLVLQKRANRILLTQFFCPLLFIQLPFYYSVLGPIVGFSQGLPTDMLPVLFAWTPVVNDLLVFILNAEIRNALIRKRKTTMVTSEAKRSVATLNGK